MQTPSHPTHKNITYAAFSPQEVCADITTKKIKIAPDTPRLSRPSPKKEILQWALALQEEIARPINKELLQSILQERDKIQESIKNDAMHKGEGHSKMRAITKKIKGENRAQTHALGEKFYEAQGVSKKKQNDVFKSALMHPWHKSAAQLQFSFFEHMGKSTTNQIFSDLKLPLAKSLSGAMSQEAASMLASGGTAFTATGTNFVIGKILENKKNPGTAAADMSLKASFVPAKTFWEVPERADAIKQMKQCLALLDKMETAGFDIPEQLQGFVKECRTLYKKISAKSECETAELLASFGTTASNSLLKFGLSNAAAAYPPIAPITVPLSMLMNSISSLIGDGLGRAAKMDQIRSKNLQYADIINDQGEIDVDKTRQLYLQQHQIKEKYIDATLCQRIAMTLHQLEKAERKFDVAQYTLRNNNAKDYRKLTDLNHRIQHLQYLIAEIKPENNKSQYMDVKMLISLKDAGFDTEQLRKTAALVSDSVRAEHRKWQAEHAQQPTQYTRDVQALFELLPPEEENINSSKKGSTLRTLSAFLTKNIKNTEDTSVNDQKSMQGKLATREYSLEKAQEEKRKLLDKMHKESEKNKSGPDLTNTRQKSSDTRKTAQDFFLHYSRGMLQNKNMLKALLNDYHVFKELSAAIHTEKSPDELQKIIQKIGDGFLQKMLINNKELTREAGKCLKSVPDIIFDGFTPNQLHLQAQGQAQHYHNDFLQKIKSFIPEATPLPDINSIVPFLIHYKFKDLSTYDSLDRTISNKATNLASQVSSVPYSIYGSRVEKEIKNAQKRLENNSSIN